MWTRRRWRPRATDGNVEQGVLETDCSRGFVRGYTLQFARGTGPVNEAITGMAADRLPWGKDHQGVPQEAERRGRGGGLLLTLC